MMQIDDRHGGLRRYRWRPFGCEPLVRIPDEYRTCVAFAFRNDRRQAKRVVSGTAFRVGFQELSYLVTARHVIEGILRDSTDGKVLLRINTDKRRSEFIETMASDWLFHPSDNDVDIAAVRLDLPVEFYLSYLVLSSEEWMVNDKLTRKKGIGVGDEIYIIGLYTNHYGKDRNIPIVRTGNIAAMQEEKIEVKWHNNASIDAYLIEARSIGGLSGSPVFVTTGRHGQEPPEIQTDEHGNTYTSFTVMNSTVSKPPPPPEHQRSGPLYFLGVVHGHCNVTVPDTDDAVKVDATGDKINAGLAIVVPATRIQEVLDHPKFLEERHRAFDAEKERTLPTPDRA